MDIAGGSEKRKDSPVVKSTNQRPRWREKQGGLAPSLGSFHFSFLHQLVKCFLTLASRIPACNLHFPGLRGSHKLGRELRTCEVASAWGEIGDLGKCGVGASGPSAVAVEEEVSWLGRSCSVYVEG